MLEGIPGGAQHRSPSGFAPFPSRWVHGDPKCAHGARDEGALRVRSFARGRVRFGGSVGLWGEGRGPLGPSWLLHGPRPVRGRRLLPKWPLGCASCLWRGCTAAVRAGGAERRARSGVHRLPAVQEPPAVVQKPPAVVQEPPGAVQEPPAAVQGGCVRSRGRQARKGHAVSPRQRPRERCACSGRVRAACSQQRAASSGFARAAPLQPLLPFQPPLSLRQQPTDCKWHLARRAGLVITHRITF